MRVHSADPPADSGPARRSGGCGPCALARAAAGPGDGVKLSRAEMKPADSGVRALERNGDKADSEREFKLGQPKGDTSWFKK